MNGRATLLLASASCLLAAARCALFPSLDGLGGAPAATNGDSGPLPDGGGGDAPTGDGAAKSAYASAVMADAPIAYWRLGDPVAPTAKDQISPGHDGIYTGGVSLGEPGALAGDPDTAARFDGVDDRVTITLPAAFDFAGKAAFSVEAWVKRSGTNMAILGKSTYATDGGYAGWFLVYNAGDVLEFDRAGSSIVQTPAPAVDHFFHVVATFDGFTLLLFVDGQQVASGASSKDLVATGAPLFIGYVDTWGTHKGVVDEVALYDKALPPARIKAHFDAAK